MEKMETKEEICKSEFTGSAVEYFGVNFAVVFLSIITLGIAYPFMHAMRLKWIRTRTFIQGRKLTFDGKGAQLLGKYLLWLLLTLVTLGIYGILCLPLNMNRWEASHTHIEDAQGEPSEFDGHIWQYFGVRFLAGFVSLITLGIGSFWAHCYLLRWEYKHTVYSGARLAFDGLGMEYFGKRFVWGLLSLITLGIYGIWVGGKELAWTVSHTQIAV